jgi:hypothetical protein
LKRSCSWVFVLCFHGVLFSPFAQNSVTLVIEEGFGWAGKDTRGILTFLQALDTSVAFEYGVFIAQLDDTEGAGECTETTSDTPDLVKGYRCMGCLFQCPGGTDFYAGAILAVKAAQGNSMPVINRRDKYMSITAVLPCTGCFTSATGNASFRIHKKNFTDHLTSLHFF